MAVSPYVTQGISFPDRDLLARAKARAASQGRSLSNYVEQLIRADLGAGAGEGQIRYGTRRPRGSIMNEATRDSAPLTTIPEQTVSTGESLEGVDASVRERVRDALPGVQKKARAMARESEAKGKVASTSENKAGPSGASPKASLQ